MKANGLKKQSISRSINTKSPTLARYPRNSTSYAYSRPDTQPSNFDRRQLLLSTTSLLLLTATPNLPAHADSSTLYVDPEDKFQLEVPSNWSTGSGDLFGEPSSSSQTNRFSNGAGLKRVVAFYPPDTPSVSISITASTVGPDYTSLGSFGSAIDWGEKLVSIMDRSYLLRAPELIRQRAAARGEFATTATLLGVKESRGMYIAEYVTGAEGQPTRKVTTAAAMGNNGRLNKLYTINVSAPEGDEYGKYEEVLKRAVDSFRAPARS
jgi:hypothetical protein